MTGPRADSGRTVEAISKSGDSRQVVSMLNLYLTIGVKYLAHALGAPANPGDETGPTIVLSIPAELRRAGQGKRLASASRTWIWVTPAWLIF